jgi:hypothetical protein
VDCKKAAPGGEKKGLEDMERTDGLILGVALAAGALRRLQNDAVDGTRRDIGLSVRRRLGHTRRLARDSAALVQLAIGVAVLIEGLRSALRERPGDAEGADPAETDIQAIA